MCESACATTETEPVIIVTMDMEGRCMAQGQRFPSLMAVRACYPLALLLVGKA